jgi:hypothetical protein
MNSKASIATVGFLLLSVVLVAGCSGSSQQPTPLPTVALVSTPTLSAAATPVSTPGPSDVAKYFEDLLITQMQFSIQQPLTHTINTDGNDVYSGTVVRGSLKSSVTIEVTNDVHDTQTKGAEAVAAFKAKGYQTTEDKADYWYGQMGTREAEVITQTMDGFVMSFETI